MVIVSIPLLVIHYYIGGISNAYTSPLITSSGLITGIIVIIHLCILKCKKKQRERKRMKKNDKPQVPFCAVSNNHNDVFTRETVASTNAHTTYHYTHTSSFTSNC